MSKKGKSQGEKIFELLLTRVGEEYVLGALVPKDDPDWAGPWDCAEIVSWGYYQVCGILYGVYDSTSNPAIADAGTVYWKRDAEHKGIIISVNKAATIPGAAVLRRSAGSGHIVISDGKGGTVEAAGAKYGVIKSTLSNRRWDMGILVPGIDYGIVDDPAAVEPEVTKPSKLYHLVYPYMEDKKIGEIQKELKELNFYKYPIDNIFGPGTHSAVLQFQRIKGLIVDGEVGPQTAKELGITL